VNVCCGGDARLDLLAEQLMRHAVVILADLDVVVETDPAALPFGTFVEQRRQRSQRGLSSCSKRARRLVPQPRIKRLFSSSVGSGHVLGDRIRPMRAQAAAMAGDLFAAMKAIIVACFRFCHMGVRQ
jgi:hypothetical protein